MEPAQATKKVGKGKRKVPTSDFEELKELLDSFATPSEPTLKRTKYEETKMTKDIPPAEFGR